MELWHHVKRLLIGSNATPVYGAVARSSRWSTVRKHHLEKHPVCEACGGTEHLQVHHVKPYHLHPELELDDGNLIVLCESPAHNCHLVFGHASSWAGYVASVREDAARHRRHVEQSKRIAEGKAA